jgi:UDP-N-acetylglucosamine pyrophosphorylase
MTRNQTPFAAFAAKMNAAGATSAGIRAFRHSYERLLAGDTGLIPESAIEPVTDLPALEEIQLAPDPALLSRIVVLKLNGGLGTSMGLEGAKSLLQAKDGLTFLDFLARQILHLRRHYRASVPFMLMNSFSTSADTLQFLRRYPELGEPASLQLLQSQVPKIDAGTLAPASWQTNPQLEWCPPGHGDIYPSLLGSGWLERLLEQGVRYMFVSNSDNLGASLDPRLLSWFARSGRPFLMEVAQRTGADRKGGHLARRDGRLLLRESAQCPENDVAAFQDINKHRFFNTNNLWIQLEALSALLKRFEGLAPLPIIKNRKTIDPRDPNSPAVIQLETAMGAAIELFEGAGAVLVPRTRFAPVKTTSDLLVLRSDAFSVNEDWTISPLALRPPVVDLDQKHYKLVDQLEAMFKQGPPSLKDCVELTVCGPVAFGSPVAVVGKVRVSNQGSTAKTLAAGNYANQDVAL